MSRCSLGRFGPAAVALNIELVLSAHYPEEAAFTPSSTEAVPDNPVVLARLSAVADNLDDMGPEVRGKLSVVVDDATLVVEVLGSVRINVADDGAAVRNLLGHVLSTLNIAPAVDLVALVVLDAGAVAIDIAITTHVVEAGGEVVNRTIEAHGRHAGLIDEVVVVHESKRLLPAASGARTNAKFDTTVEERLNRQTSKLHSVREMDTEAIRNHCGGG